MAQIGVDLLANALCLCLMLRLMGRRIRLRRTAGAAMLGAAIACLARLMRLSRMQTALGAAAAAYAMAALALGGGSVRGAVLLLSAAGLLGGVITAIAGATGSLRAAWGLGAGCVALMAAQAVRAQRAAQDVTQARVEIALHGRTAAFEAIVDSGNSLRDYLTHRPVIVLPEHAARERLGLGGAVLRPIFANTAGGRQMMSCITPEKVTLYTGGQAMEVSACVALSPGLGPGAPALVPQTLTRPEEGAELETEGMRKSNE